MAHSLSLGRWFGIRVGVHVSWIVVFVVVSLGLAGALRELHAPAPLALGALAALILFASVLAHELAHALVARRFGVATRCITLFLFGGVAMLEEEPSTPRADAWVAVAGPALSAVLAGTFFAILMAIERSAAGPAAVALAALCAYAAVANGILAGFNLVPAYPTDGGRILRALLWARTGSFARATLIAARVGFGCALLLGAVGIAIPLATHAWSYGWYLALAAFLGRSSWLQMRSTLPFVRFERVRAAAALVPGSP